MYKNSQYDTYNEFGQIKKQNQFNCRNKLLSKTKNWIAFFSDIATNHVYIVFKQPIDNIKEVNQKYVTP